MSDGYYVDRFGKGNYLALKFEDIDPDVTSLLIGLQGEQTEFDFNSDEYYVLKVEDVTKPLVITATNKADNTVTTKVYSLSELLLLTIRIELPEPIENPDSYEGNTCDVYLEDVNGIAETLRFNTQRPDEEGALIALLQLDHIAEDSNGEAFNDINITRSVGVNNFAVTLAVPEETEWVDVQFIATYTDSRFGDCEYTVGVRFIKP